MAHILVVDDEQQILDLVSSFLEINFPDAYIVTATDGLEAYAECSKLKFDLIITDHKMPFCTGLEFIKKLRQVDNANASIPIIVVSGFIPLIENEISTLDNLYYLDKPFAADRLIKYCKMTLNPIK